MNGSNIAYAISFAYVHDVVKNVTLRNLLSGFQETASIDN